MGVIYTNGSMLGTYSAEPKNGMGGFAGGCEYFMHIDECAGLPYEHFDEIIGGFISKSFGKSQKQVRESRESVEKILAARGVGHVPGKKRRSRLGR